MDSSRFVGAVLLLTMLAAGPFAAAQPAGPPSSPETRSSQPAPPQQPVKAVKTSLEMKVQGVLAIGEGDDRRSSAVIAMKSGGQARAYSPGQLIDDNPDLKLVKIQDERIEFVNHGQLEFAPVKQFPDANSSGGGGSSYSPSSYSAADAKTSPDAQDPAKTPFRRPRPARRPGAGADDAIVPAAADQGPDGQ